MLSGDFDGYPWCLVIAEFPSVGTCISIEGAASSQGGERLPESEQLLSGACDGPISGLGWQSTGPNSARVAYGHAPTDATSVRFIAQGSDAVDLDVRVSLSFEGATFFAAQLPPDFFPDAAVAMKGKRELERNTAITTVFTRDR